ncbi:MAG: APC family permease [Acidobacteriales bacterium]|nr:APC family permease [Terriglobales bacterium]
MSSTVEVTDQRQLLRRELGLRDLILFNIAAVLGPRWIAAAAHNGTSSVSLWVLAALFFFVPTALVIVELSTRYPHEGGVYAWTKEAFGDFHGFVAGWCYWIYSFFYFPGLLLASVAMSVYIGGPNWAWLGEHRTYLVIAALVLLGIAVTLNIVGLNVGKWLQNAGGVSTYVPLVILVVVAYLVTRERGPATAITPQNIWPVWDWSTVNFWSQIAFAFTGMELASCMSEEVRNPQKNFPRAIFGSGLLIAVIYIVGTIAVLFLLSPKDVNVHNGVFQAITGGSAILGVTVLGVIAAGLVTVGNAGGVGATVAGVSRVPFVAGVDRYLPPAFGKLHPRWRTPFVAILVQAGISAIILVLYLYNETVKGGYQALVSATVVVYFIPFLYMYAAAIKLSYRADRQRPGAVLIPGGRAGVWIAGILGFAVTALSIVLACFPTDDVTNTWVYEAKLLGGTVIAVAFGLFLYRRGARQKQGLTR